MTDRGTDVYSGLDLCICNHYRLQHDIENGCQVCRWDGRGMPCKAFQGATWDDFVKSGKPIEEAGK